MDRVMLGQRVASAREEAGMSQERLGTVVQLDRSAISRLEKGERKINVPELVNIAAALNRPLTYFVEEPVPAVVSRRRDAVHAHPTTRLLDNELELFAGDVRMLVEMDVLTGGPREPERLPTDHASAEQTAAKLRSRLGLHHGPIIDLDDMCEHAGLYTFTTPLSGDGADGACVEVAVGDENVGAAVINGESPWGRRRMTLAHELGHWVFGDAYDMQASQSSEQMINSFAIHFMAPRAGVTSLWNERRGDSTRDRALVVAAHFRLSWSAIIGQLRNLDIIDGGQHRQLSEVEPRAGDYLRLGLGGFGEAPSTRLSPGFSAAVLNAFVSQRLTVTRTVELLRGTLRHDELPERAPLSPHDLRRSFQGHDG